MTKHSHLCMSLWGAFLLKAPQVPWIYMKGIPVDTMKEAELSKVQPRPYTLQEKVEQLQK